MESTYKHKITTMDGTEREITLNRLTMRHGVRLQGKEIGDATELLIDMVAPEALDIIAPESLAGLVEIILETEKDFFVQLSRMALPGQATK